MPFGVRFPGLFDIDGMGVSEQWDLLWTWGEGYAFSLSSTLNEAPNGVESDDEDRHDDRQLCSRQLHREGVVMVGLPAEDTCILISCRFIFSK